MGVTEAEIDKLRAAVLKAPGAGPLEPYALKKRIGDAAGNPGLRVSSVCRNRSEGRQSGGGASGSGSGK
jgi:hypothetical protein